jgi:hypothetical protein
MASYIIQAVSAIILGPVLHFFPSLERFNTDEFNQFLDMIKDDLLLDINLGNTWIMISIMIAAQVRQTQSPTVFEIDFLSALLYFQMFLAFARSATMLIYFHKGFLPTDPNYTSKKVKLYAMQTFIFLTIFTVPFIANGTYPAGPQTDALTAISKYCAFENDLPIPVITSPVHKPEGPEPWWKYPAMMLFVVSVPILFVSCCDTRPRPGAITATGRAGKVFLYLFYAAGWLGVGFLPYLFFAQMRDSRETMRLALGQKYQDMAWGFGQVAVLVMWFPTLLHVLHAVFCIWPIHILV